MQLPTLLITKNELNKTELSHLVPFSRLENNPDIIWVRPLEEKTSISIDQVHELIGKLIYKPVMEKHKVALISPAHALTLPAQQALLKTLEEPPENTQLILLTSFPGKLLPTILSRASLIQSEKEKEQGNESALYEDLQKFSISTCLTTSDEWSKNKEETLEKLHSLLKQLREVSHQNPSAKILVDERAIMSCIEQLERNINAKLALDQLFFSISFK